MEKKKNYQEPKFELVRTDEQNRVFFAASGTPGPTTSNPSGSLGSMTSTTGGWI